MRARIALSVTICAVAVLGSGCQQLIESVASGVTVESDRFPGVMISCDGISSPDDCGLFGDIFIEANGLNGEDVRLLTLDFERCYAYAADASGDGIAAGSFGDESGC